MFYLWNIEGNQIAVRKILQLFGGNKNCLRIKEATSKALKAQFQAKIYTLVYCNIFQFWIFTDLSLSRPVQ